MKSRVLIMVIGATILVSHQTGFAQGQIGVSSASPKDDLQARDPGTTLGSEGQFGLWRRNPWYGSSGIRADLGISQVQYDRLNSSYLSAFESYQRDLDQLSSDLSLEQRQQLRAQHYVDFQKRFHRDLDSGFEDRDWRKRYDQLNLQYQGLNAFNDPSIQSRLNLTDEQSRQLRGYASDFERQYAKWYRQYPRNRLELQAEFDLALLRNRQKINQVLTPSQQAIWREMTGAPYNFRMEDYFPLNAPPVPAQPAIP